MIRHVFKSIWIVVRSFSLGLLAGLLVAPHKGSETRRLIHDRLMDLFDRALPSGSDAGSTGSPARHDGRGFERQERRESDAAAGSRPLAVESRHTRERGGESEAEL